eukprot:751118-Hanusia_phi.AAC.4
MAVSTSLVPFSNTNPYADNFRLKVRPILIDGESFMIRQSWDERAEDEPEPTGLKWTGAAIWDAAILLSEYLAKNHGLLKGKNVLELGSGHGLVSVVCARFGARKVTATDYDERVLKLARDNVKSNLQEDSITQCIEVKQLGWGTSDLQTFEKFSFDLIVGSDVVYNKELFKPLIETIEALLSSSGILVLAYKPRLLRTRFEILLT